MKTIFRATLWLFYIGCVATSSISETAEVVELPDLFADHMVLQRDTEVRVWGKAPAGERVTVSLRDAQRSAITDENGQWEVILPAVSPGLPCEMRISSTSEEKVFRDVLVGDVWLCAGQSNMGFRMSPNLPWSAGVIDYETEIANSADPGLRIFTCPIQASPTPQRDPHGIWLQADPAVAGNFSAVAYYFGRELRANRQIPIGMIVAAVGASSISSWMEADLVTTIPRFRTRMEATAGKIANTPAEDLEAYKLGLAAYLENARMAMKENRNAPPFKEPFHGFRYQPSFLYNAMIAPLTQYPVAGFVWYQGEADTRIASDYGAAFKTLITGWRSEWNQPHAPFLFVQLAGYDPVAKGSDAVEFEQSWADLRGAQAEALGLLDTAMVVAADLGDPETVHPRDKKTVARRLALAAGNHATGSLPATPGPQAESALLSDTSISVKFRTAIPLKVAQGARETPIQIAGSEGKYLSVKAMIDGRETISATIPEGWHPVAVRYAWENNPEIWICDADGLPAPPFQLPLTPDDSTAP